MGAAGAASRILTIGYGAPITYAAFGEAVAPGQVPMHELIDIYRADQLNAKTRVYGIAGEHSLTSFSPFLHSPAFAARGMNFSADCSIRRGAAPAVGIGRRLAKQITRSPRSQLPALEPLPSETNGTNTTS